MRRTLAALAATLCLVALGSMPVLAEDALTHSAVPQIEPVVLGEVTAMNAHRVTVQVPGEEAMAFEYDSRTVMPQEIDMGTRVRVEFHMLDSGLHLAKRVTPLTIGSKDWSELDKAMADASYRGDEDEDVDNDMNHNVTADYPNEHHHDMSTTSDNQTNMSEQDAKAAHEAAEREEERREAAEREADRHDTDRDDLSSTASDLPMFLGIGLALLATALGLRWMRRRSA